MPRPISWQSDLVNIHRKVAESPRSPYNREDLQKLFGVGPSAAVKLMGLMPRMAMANLQVVERAGLLEFLGGALDAEDLRAYLEALRKDPPSVTRRKLRMAIPRDFQPGDHKTLPDDVQLWRGELGIRFTTLDDLAGKLYQLMRALEAPDFERKFCQRAAAAEPTAEEKAQAQDADRIRAETKLLHKVASIEKASEHRQRYETEGPDRAVEMIDLVIGSLRKEAQQALTAVEALHAAIGITQSDVVCRSRAKLASLFADASACPQTAWPASSFPPGAEPSPLRALEDRSAS